MLPERDSYVSVGYALCILCGLATSIANPILYTVFNSTFKKQVKRKLGKWRRRLFSREKTDFTNTRCVPSHKTST